VARRLELATATASSSEPSDAPEVGVEHDDAVIGGVRNNHVTVLGDRDPVWPTGDGVLLDVDQVHRGDLSAGERLDHGDAMTT